MAATQSEQAFREFVQNSQRRLIHLADLLTGDRETAEDLTQRAFVRVYLAWSRLQSGDPEAYARRCIVNANVDRWRRRPWREVSTAEVPEHPSHVDETSRVEQRLTILRALSTLTSKERAVVVLRYYADLNEEQIADTLDCARGTVKSTAARAVGKLRDALQRQEETMP